MFPPNLLEQQAFSQYLASLEAQYQQAMNSAYQHDQQLAQQRQENMNKYLDRQVDIQNSYQPPIINTPQHTNCSIYGNQMNCTTF